MTKQLQGKVALVTGGSSGIGKAIAELLAQNGASVVIGDMNEATGRKAADEITSRGGRAVFCDLNVADESAWKKAMGFIEKTFDRLDIAVNDAGILVEDNAETVTLENLKKLEAINIDGVVLGTKYEIEFMKRNRTPDGKPAGGSIIEMCSSSALVGIPNLASYSVTKGAILAYTRSAAIHCAKAGTHIRVNCVCPGYIETPMVAQMTKTNPEEYARLVALHPMGRLGTPEEVAQGVLYLASPTSSFTTGTNLVIDGGYTEH